MTRPLQGIRVLDLTQIYQGPYAAFLLAQAGAEVLKVEPIGGERLRGTGSKVPLSFAMLNSCKRSVTLDLKAPDGKVLLVELAKHADVLLENYGPGVMDRLGLGWEVMHEANPKLVYVSGTGFGFTGPDSDLLAMDHTIQAATGMMAATGDEGQPPMRAGGASCDILGGAHMYGGALTALLGRHATGRGTFVETTMMEAMYFTLSTELTTMFTTGKNPPRSSTRSPARVAPYSIHRCRDGKYVAIICVSEHHWHAVARLIDRAELIDDPAYERLGRIDKQGELQLMIDTWSAGLDQDAAVAALRAEQVPTAPVRDVIDVYNNQHMLARGTLVTIDHPVLGPVNLPTSPLRFSGYDANELVPYPALGSSNAYVYGDLLGRSETELADFAARGVI